MITYTNKNTQETTATNNSSIIFRITTIWPLRNDNSAAVVSSVTHHHMLCWKEDTSSLTFFLSTSFIPYRVVKTKEINYSFWQTMKTNQCRKITLGFLFWPLALETHFQWQSIASCQFVILHVGLISPDWMWSMQTTKKKKKKSCTFTIASRSYSGLCRPLSCHSLINLLDINHKSPLRNTVQKAISLQRGPEKFMLPSILLTKPNVLALLHLLA